MNHFLMLVLFLSTLTIWSDADAQSERICEDGKRSYFGVCPEDPATRPPSDVPSPPKPDPPRETRQAVEPELVRIPEGCFQMGHPEWKVGLETWQMMKIQMNKDERWHRVCVNNFEIGRYEVTQRQWRVVMDNNPSYFQGCDDCPVEQVSWHDAQAYIVKLNQRTGKNYRLPTEAEWEYACRGGREEQRYCGGNDVDRLAWQGNRTGPVGKKNPNLFGLYDMSGNVWEWTCSIYDKEYGGAEQVCNYSNTNDKYVTRGGSWNTDPQYWAKSFLRNSQSPDKTNWGNPGNHPGFQGFRLARSL